MPENSGSHDDEGDVVEVMGVRCPLDHHNHPDAMTCWQCRRRMGVNRTAVQRLGPRPPLGQLLAATGEVYLLDRTVLLAPRGGDSAAESAQVEITIEGWTVIARNVGASGAVELHRSGESRSRTLTNAGTILRSRDVLSIGALEFQVDLLTGLG